MNRLGLTNIYLKCGLLLILFGIVCGLIVFNVQLGGTRTRELMLWGAMGGFMSGLVLYGIGRIKHALRNHGRSDARS